MIDYCLVEAENLERIEWDLEVEDLGGWLENDEKVMKTPQRKTRLIVPDNYLEDLSP